MDRLQIVQLSLTPVALNYSRIQGTQWLLTYGEVCGTDPADIPRRSKQHGPEP